jgi:hypothetical protein
MKTPRGSSGVSLIEVLLYIGLLIMIVAVVTSTLLALSRVQQRISASRALSSAAHASFERMVEDIHNATAINTSDSTFNASPGALGLATLDESGIEQDVRFFLVGESLHVEEDGVDIGPLNATSTRITNLIFNEITSSSSVAIRIQMTIEAGSNTSYQSKTFYNTAVLRGSYTQ